MDPTIPPDLTQRIAESDYIAGSDECGYGAWAGPLVVCAVVVSREWPGAYWVKDSKALSPKKRIQIAEKILPSVVYEMVSVSSEEVDREGVYTALLSAHQRALEGAIKKHEAIGCVGKVIRIVDGTLNIPDSFSLPKADALIPAVSAASILGKVARDAHMVREHDKYPGYGFEHHSGYGTPEHQQALKKLGACPIHRRSYAPIQAIISRDEEPREAWELPED